jgi:O-acetyl-ADP-ribose deacetylase (regulator of RNase III)
MIKRKGDLFTTDAAALGHGVNVKGLMGAGIAKVFKEKFPKNYGAYRRACDVKLLKPGEAFIYFEDNKYVVNLSTQREPGPDASYKWVLYAAADAALQLAGTGVDRLAIPMIGCGIGGLEWPGVEHILRAVEIIVPNFEFEVWKL